MLVSLHFPFADARGFLLDEAGRLLRPHWKLPDINNDFVRHFGPLRIRLKGGSKLFRGEHTVCRADNAIRFPTWHEKTMRCVFRGFYADGEAFAKFDIGIVRSRGAKERASDEGGEPPLQLRDLAHRVLNMPAIVPLANPQAHSRLGNLGPQLARAYLLASTISKPAVAPPNWTLRAGSSVITILHNKNDNVVLPRESTVGDSGGVSVAHWWMPFGGTRRRVWSLGYAGDDYALARQLRIDLVRWHCEREVLRLVLTLVATKKLAPATRSLESDALQRYLNEAISRVTSLDEDRQRSLATLVVATQDERANEELEELRRDLEEQLRSLDVRPNIRRKAGAFAAGPVLEGRVSEIDRLGLEKLITKSYSLEDFKRLCLVMGDLMQRDGIENALTADFLGGDALPDRVANLTSYAKRYELMDYLRRAIEEQHPEYMA